MTSSTEARTRRTFLGAGLGALAASVVAAIVRPDRALAEDEFVQVGGEYTTATSRTRIRNETNSNDVLVAESGTGNAISGVTGSGTGGFFLSDSGFGVIGECATGRGVEATTQSGVGLYARANAAGGYAIDAIGRIRLSTSGVATIAAGATGVTITLPAAVPVTDSSFVLVSPNADLGTRRLWWAKNTTANTITVRMKPSRETVTKVSWLLLG